MFFKRNGNEKIKYYLTEAIRILLFLLVPILIVIFIAIAYFISKDSVNTYTTINSRLSIFYLGSIVTMNVYIYTKTFSMSSIQFSSPFNSIIMGFGVFFSFLSLLTLPTRIYYPDPIIQNYIQLVFHLDWNRYMVLGLINFASFITATLIFTYTLINFVSSFNIDKIIYRNYIGLSILSEVDALSSFNKTSALAYEQKVNNRVDIKPLNKKDMVKINKKLDIYNQNLMYLLTLKNSQLTSKYLTRWRTVVGTVQKRLFHSPKVEDLNKDLYNMTLALTNKLIIETSNSISLKKYNHMLLTTIFNSIPLFGENLKEEKLDGFKYNYKKNYDLLIKSYYIELHKIIEYLYFSGKNENVLQTLANNEVGFFDSTVNQSKFIENKANVNLENERNYLEDIFIGFLFNIINSNNNVDLPVILSLLFKVQNVTYNENDTITDGEIIPSTYGSAKVFGSLSNTLKKLGKDIQKGESNFSRDIKKAEESVTGFNESDLNLKLDEKTVKYLIIAITKACEIENYKAVGYLTKRLCNHLSFDEIFPLIEELKVEIYEDKIKDLILSKITLNDYSLKYCFHKTIIILLLQSYYSDRSIVKEYKSLLELEFRESILDSLQDRHKEYNLSCIKEDVINDLLTNKQSKILIV
ncbi:hypothetical protein [Sporosarcina ureilytica]|uniref:Uncharacterized protein n=1 Tax=Sporosarcina ureilytica TaxID=298596 RepID=A0A1D8JFC4_9BACL|nr:hypothetical protein [Sporosarcina ureilytica]AOV07410.1 hypothetical protein BI350_07575 [Sporosarcina ureilytica]